MQKLTSKRAVITQILLWAALALIAATQTWVTIGVDAASGEQLLESAGQNLNPAIPPIAIALLAAAVALTIAGAVFRRILGVLVMLLGAGLTALTVGVMRDPVSAAAGALSELTGLMGAGNIELVTSVEVTVWPTILGVAGVLACLAGLLVTVASGRWSAGSKKYESSTAAAASARGGSDRISDWDALSDGEDPSDDGDTDDPRSTSGPRSG